MREKCSKDLLENIPEKSGPNYLYHEVLALCHYLQSDLDKAKEEANNYRIDNQKEMKMEHARSAAVINSGREKMIEAIIDKDRDLFVKACIDGLKKFSSTFDKKRDVPLEPLILSYLTLARERGIGIEEEDIPEKLRLFVFRFFEDEGQG